MIRTDAWGRADALLSKISVAGFGAGGGTVAFESWLCVMDDKSCPPRSIRFGKKSKGARVAEHAAGAC